MNGLDDKLQTGSRFSQAIRRKKNKNKQQASNQIENLLLLFLNPHQAYQIIKKKKK